MTLGTAIVVVMLLYLLDKHGKLKQAAGIVIVLVIVGLGWTYGSEYYASWKLERYIRRHVAMKEALISKYRTPKQADGLSPAGVRYVEKLDLPPGATLVSVPKHKLCGEPQFGELTDGEKHEVLQTIWPTSDVFDRVSFIDNCNK
jgi:hypothetical protein